ncbi:MAG: hypothetical protein HC850_03190 [Rhodomicrobium sp.]|nr:hypothetical protein [Rhodomicrobium sp.]
MHSKWASARIAAYRNAVFAEPAGIVSTLTSHFLAEQGAQYDALRQMMRGVSLQVHSPRPISDRDGA